MKLVTRVQLSLMMFLMFFMWGAWYGQMSKYLLTQLNATGDQVGNAYTAFSLAMIIAPFFMGMIADRYFAAQRVMGVLCLAGAGILYFLMKENNPDRFFYLILAYCITFAPLLALSNSIAMQQMVSPEKEFPGIRVMGTIAWILVTNIVGYYGFGDKHRFLNWLCMRQPSWVFSRFSCRIRRPNKPMGLLFRKFWASMPLSCLKIVRLPFSSCPPF